MSIVQGQQATKCTHLKEVIQISTAELPCTKKFHHLARCLDVPLNLL